MLLDTCALLWLAAGGAQLSARARAAIERAPALYVSAVTGFEVGVKVSKGKLVLPARPADWFDGVLRQHGIEVVPLDLATCLLATELPAVHADPCDRFIIATARRHQLAIVTADSRFRDYSVEVVW